MIIGTRGSELALRQAAMVIDALVAAHPGIEVTRKVIATTGDKRTDLRFSEFTDAGRFDKGIFTKELEAALGAGEIDAAVHSLKDVPTEIDPGFVIAATLPRAAVEDVLVSRDGLTLHSIPPGARIGTSSVRRIRQLRWLRPEAVCVEIRGNVPTRVRKLIPPSTLDAVLLARAGLERLGLLEGAAVSIDGRSLAATILPCDEFLPAAGQGAIAIEARRGDAGSLGLLRGIGHAETLARVSAEREFLRLLRAGCQTPIGAHTWIAEGRLHLRVRVFGEGDGGGPPFEGSASAPLAEPELAAAELAQRLGGA